MIFAGLGLTLQKMIVQNTISKNVGGDMTAENSD
jgi:hypothetical protein